MFSWLEDHLSGEQLDVAARFYETVEWAPIREARFKQLTLRGVPATRSVSIPSGTAWYCKDRLLADRTWETYRVGLKAVLAAMLDRPEESAVLAPATSPRTSNPTWRR